MNKLATAIALDTAVVTRIIADIRAPLRPKFIPNMKGRAPYKIKRWVGSHRGRAFGTESQFV